MYRLFDLSSGQHLLDLGSELRNGAGQLDLAWLDQATVLAGGYDTCTRLWDTRCSGYVRTWEEPFDESGTLSAVGSTGINTLLMRPCVFFKGGFSLFILIIFGLGFHAGGGG